MILAALSLCCLPLAPVPSAGAPEPVPAPLQEGVSIDKRRFRLGDPATFDGNLESVGTVRSTEIYDATPERKQIVSEGIEPGNPSYNRLMKEATKRYKEALRKTAEDLGLQFIVEEKRRVSSWDPSEQKEERGSGSDPAPRDVTLEVIARLDVETEISRPVFSPVTTWLQDHIGSLTDLYEHLHANPELSLQEHETAATLAAWMREAGFTVTEGVGGTGVVAVLENGPGPTVLVRCDMDALPIVERTGFDYASEVTVEQPDGTTVGVMHACGHDVHMSVWAGTASYLAAHPDAWSGTLVMIAQPAEELGMGAKAMLEDGLYERFPKPDYALALHAKAEIGAGKVGTVSGWALANVDTVDILVRGEGGHGSAPHRTHDPVTLAARIVMGLQTIVSREVAPLQPAVVTVGSIHGGTKHNIIPNEVEMQLTVRSYDPEVRQQLLDAIVRTAEHEARAAGFPETLLPVVEISDTQETPATWNTPELVTRVDAAIERELGEGTVVEAGQVMGAEDFGRYGPAAGCPSYLFWLGTSHPVEIHHAKRGEGPWPPSVHTDRYGTPRPGQVLETGVRAMGAAVLDLLPPAG